ncbi:MBL fold metallo-hydrolase [Microcoleus sp. FACHB-672]|uniref:MBL fold metallo-hydrolase n=1 Tax=Microcoleus sp. FACHB-672 TaxID=2692825 RepID=UPI0016876A1D|nr:MBL fold metallo-hydrolase [Microcoleus sp. FACHB-672]MBD2044019.1 MBL fold metallo-hydrolase [Microcoleus sp. FACHB-672]
MANSHSSDFVVQFWGVRGSVPSPGKDTVRYGGNTSCMEMRLGDKRLIFDGGTGLQRLGQHLLKEMPVTADIFFTHYHWDHIQGFPFFTPAFIQGNSFHIHGAVPPDAESMKQHFIERVLHPNSPVPISGMQADLKFSEVMPGDVITLDDITLETGHLNHPNNAMGYRVTWRGHTVFYCTDTEHFPDRIDESVLHLARDADLFIYDAMYTDEEYHNPKSPKIGWGHSTWQEGARIAKEAGVKRFVVFHHEPTHSDEFLDRMAEEVYATCPNAVLAYEGMILDVTEPARLMEPVKS